jgi:hypothetical protein
MVLLFVVTIGDKRIMLWLERLFIHLPVSLYSALFSFPMKSNLTNKSKVLSVWICPESIVETLERF